MLFLLELIRNGDTIIEGYIAAENIQDAIRQTELELIDDKNSIMGNYFAWLTRTVDNGALGKYTYKYRLRRIYKLTLPLQNPLSIGDIVGV